MRIMRKMAGGCLAMALCVWMGGAVTAYAGSAISEVKIRVTDSYDGTGGTIREPSIQAAGNGYQVEEVAWSQETDQWKPGEMVTASVTLAAEGDDTFQASYQADQVSVNGAQFVSAIRGEDGRLVVEAEYYPVVQLGKPSYAGWSDSSAKKASWAAVPYATSYQLRLYRENDEYITTLTLGGTSVDLSSYMEEQGCSYYQVRAVSRNSADAVYRRNGAYVRSTDAGQTQTAQKAEARWERTKDGYSYVDENGNQASGGWRYIDGTWYYFDDHGYAVTGWQEIGGKWYYMDEDCRMKTGWFELDGKWYYTAPTGAMVTGWYQMTPSVWYYFYENGVMAADTTVDGYQIGADGKRE